MKSQIKTQDVLNSALGGVLVIDECYSLGHPEKRDSYSKECIDVINQFLTRRDFLVKSITAISAIYIIPEIMPPAVAAKPLDKEVDSSTKWAMNVDVDKCVEGCSACVDACVDENGLYGFDRPETDSQWIRKLKLTKT